MSYEGASRRNKLTVREILSKLAKQSEELLNPSVSVVEDEFKNVLVELVEPRSTGEKKDMVNQSLPCLIFDLSKFMILYLDTRVFMIPNPFKFLVQN